MNTQETIEQVMRSAGMISSAPLEMKLMVSLITRLSQVSAQRGTGFLIMHDETLTQMDQLPEMKNLYDREYRASKIEEGYRGLLYGMVVFTHEAVPKDAIYAAEIGVEGDVIISMGVKFIAE